MADLYAANIVGESLKPVIKVGSPAYGGRLRRFRAVLNLGAATTTTGSGSDTVAVTTSDNVLLARLPSGACFAFGILTSSVTLGSAVVAIGTSKTHGSNGQYHAAATFTATDTPTLFGLAAAIGGSANSADVPVYLTCATANLPTSGTLIVDLYCSQG